MLIATMGITQSKACMHEARSCLNDKRLFPPLIYPIRNIVYVKPIDFKSRSKVCEAIKFRVAIVVIEMQLNLSEIVSIYSSHNAHRPITRRSFENKKINR